MQESTSQGLDRPREGHCLPTTRPRLDPSWWFGLAQKCSAWCLRLQKSHCAPCCATPGPSLHCNLPPARHCKSIEVVQRVSQVDQSKYRSHDWSEYPQHGVSMWYSWHPVLTSWQITRKKYAFSTTAVLTCLFLLTVGQGQSPRRKCSILGHQGQLAAPFQSQSCWKWPAGHSCMRQIVQKFLVKASLQVAQRKTAQSQFALDDHHDWYQHGFKLARSHVERRKIWPANGLVAAWKLQKTERVSA